MKSSKTEKEISSIEINVESIKELLKRYLFWSCILYIYYEVFPNENDKLKENKKQTDELDKKIKELENKETEKLEKKKKEKEELKEKKKKKEELKKQRKELMKKERKEYNFNDKIGELLKNILDDEKSKDYLKGIKLTSDNTNIEINGKTKVEIKFGKLYNELINDIATDYIFNLHKNQTSTIKYNSTYMNIGRYNIVMHKKNDNKDDKFDDYDGFTFEFYGNSLPNLKKEVESNFNNIAKNNNYISFADLFDDKDEKIKNFFEAYFKVYEDHLLTDSLIFLDKNRNLILHGAPGTGKTFLANKIAEKLINSSDKKDIEKQVKNVQFHPSYDYTDFIEGLRPTKNGNEIVFKRIDGHFKAFCKEAAKDENKDKNYVFIIDEINRGEISKIFGEIFSLIEKDYRGKKIQTQYQGLFGDEQDIFKDGFYIPDNVYIIGTMNDIDKGVDSIDFAIRRRFIWKEIKAKDTQNSILNNKIKDEGKKFLPEIIERMNALNKDIEDDPELGTDYQIGAGYFKNITIDDNGPNYDELWETALEPLLKEYLRGRGNLGLESFKKAYELKNKEKSKSKNDKLQSNAEEDTLSEVEDNDNDE